MAGTVALNGSSITFGDSSGDTITVTGTMTASTAITITPTTNQLVLGTTRTITISATQPATSSRTYTMPDAGANANFLMSESTQTVNGRMTGKWIDNTKTVSASGTTSLVVGDETFVNMTGTAAQTIRLPDTSTLTTGTRFVINSRNSTGTAGSVTVQTNGGTATLTSLSQNYGATFICVSTGTNAADGWLQIGNNTEVISTSGSGTSGGSGSFSNAASIALPAGTWEISGALMLTGDGTTTSTQNNELAISTTTASSSGTTFGYDYVKQVGFASAGASGTYVSMTIPKKTTTTTATYYLNYLPRFGGGTPSYNYSIVAVRRA